MTNEERQRTMDFILAQQAQFWASVQKVEESHARFEESQQNTDLRTKRHDRQMDRLERILKLVIKAGLRERKHVRSQDALVKFQFEALRESQVHSDKRLDALIDIIREQRNGRA